MVVPHVQRRIQKRVIEILIKVAVEVRQSYDISYIDLAFSVSVGSRCLIVY